MRSFELVAEGKLTPQVQALDQSARKCHGVEADIGAAFARRSVGVRLEHNHPEWHVEVATLIDKGHASGPGGSGVVGVRLVSSDVYTARLAPAVRD